MASLKSMFKGSRKRVKSTRKKPRSNNMAKRKRSSRKRVSRGISSGFRNIGNKIPIVGKAFRNPTIRNVFAGIGAVSVITSLALASRNPTAIRIVSNPIVRAGTAFVVGDVAGGVAQLAQDRGLLQQVSGMSGGNQGLSSTSGVL